MGRFFQSDFQGIPEISPTLRTAAAALGTAAAATKKGAKSTKKTAAKASGTKPAPAKKDWNKMTEDEWNAAEQDALDPEDR